MKKSKKSKLNVAESSTLDDACIDKTDDWKYPHILVETTLAILKPDVEEHHDDIESHILEKGFNIIHVFY